MTRMLAAMSSALSLSIDGLLRYPSVLRVLGRRVADVLLGTLADGLDREPPVGGVHLQVGGRCRVGIDAPAPPLEFGEPPRLELEQPRDTLGWMQASEVRFQPIHVFGGLVWLA